MTVAREWAHRGTTLLAAGRFEEAQQCFARAGEVEPNVATHWALLGKCQAMRLGYHAAEETLARACSLEPQAAYVHVWLAHALREQNKPEAAIAAFERAAALDADNLTAALGAALMTPVIYRDETEITQWRDRYATGLERLSRQASERPGWSATLFELEWTNFYLAYQGKNDRDLQIRYSDFIAQLLARAGPEWHGDVHSAACDSSPISVAFVSANLRNHTVTDYFAHWITDLPRDQFRVSAFHTGPGTDERTALFRVAVEHFEHLPDDARRVAAALRAHNPDVIVYPDVGMSPLDALLTNMRLAPIQMAAWGHPVTTGSRYIDAFLSCSAMESPDAQAHYREDLILLPGIGVDYHPRESRATATRTQFRLTESAHLYVCPHSLFKIHPATDALLLDILEQDPGAVLVFIAPPARGQTDAFIERITSGMRRRNMPMRNQLKFLPNLDRSAFLDLLRVCDVMVDPLHWSGGNTALDALSVGLPIVTLPGQEMRARQSAAMLRIAGVAELVAHDGSDYVAKALRLANEPRYRAQISERIRDGAPNLFDRHDATAALADAIEGCHRRLLVVPRRHIPGLSS